MKTCIKRVSLFFFFLLFPLSSFAWNALGHMVVANIAYKQLQQQQPNVIDKIDNLVSYMHKEYADVPTFLQMAYWPDSIRSQKIETYTHWHYTDVAFSDDGTPLKNLIDTDNAVWALNNIEKVVKNNKANPYERARFLAFFVHIVGDLHQPMHTVSRISAAHPDGDRGGNDYFIRYQNDRMNLHRLWDGGVGNFDLEATNENANTIANIIMALYPKTYFSKQQLDDLNPNDWLQEGVANAKNYAYNTPENTTLSNAYVENGKKISQQEVALAGYRLAALLKQLLA